MFCVPPLIISKLTGGKNEKPARGGGGVEMKNYVNKWFPLQILLHKSKEKRTEVIGRLLFTQITKTFELFQYIFILVSQL